MINVLLSSALRQLSRISHYLSSLHIPLTTLSISIHNCMVHHLHIRKETKNIPNPWKNNINLSIKLNYFNNRLFSAGILKKISADNTILLSELSKQIMQIAATIVNTHNCVKFSKNEKFILYNNKKTEKNSYNCKLRSCLNFISELFERYFE